jgi:hypothetical protein
MTGDSQEEVSGRDGPVGEPELPLRGGSLPLPGLKHWRLRKRLSQKELARRAGLASHHLYKIDAPRTRRSANTVCMSSTSNPSCVDSPEADPVERKRWNSPDAQRYRSPPSRSSTGVSPSRSR